MQTVHQMIKSDYTLTVTLDEEVGDFRLVCKPPPNHLMLDLLPELNRTRDVWLKQIALGLARRNNNGQRISTRQVHINCSNQRNGVQRGVITYDH